MSVPAAQTMETYLSLYSTQRFFALAQPAVLCCWDVLAGEAQYFFPKPPAPSAGGKTGGDFIRHADMYLHVVWVTSGKVISFGWAGPTPRTTFPVSKQDMENHCIVTDVLPCFPHSKYLT